MKRYAIHICGPHTSVPRKGAECREAVWSEGGACRTCDHEGCPQQGMTKTEATLENARRVNPPSKCPLCGRQTRIMERRSGRDYFGHTCGCRMILPESGTLKVLWKRTKQKVLTP